MVVAWLVRQLELVVEKLGVVDAKSAVLAAHADHLVDHVQTSFWDLVSLVLVRYDGSNFLEAVLADVKQALGCTPTKVLIFLSFELLVHVIVVLHHSVEVLLHDVVVFCVRTPRAWGT